MSKEEKRVPELRFKGFFEDWEQRKFNNIVDRISISSDDENLPRVEYEDIISGQGVLNKDVYSKNSEKQGIEFRPNDILFGKLRPYLNKWLNPKFKGIAVGDFWVLRTREIESKFVYYLIQTFKFKSISNISTGTKMPRSDWSIVSNSNFFVPQEYHESEKISEFISYLENSMALHQHKIQILEKIKNKYLYKIFPKEGKNEPELRFNSFYQAWEQRELTSFYAVTMGHSPKSENYTSNPNDYILVQGNADILNGWVSPRVWTTQVTSLAPAGSILISVRAPVGNVGKTAHNVVIGRGMAAIEGDEFIFQLLSKMHIEKYWKRVSTGSTFESINSKDIKEALIKLPDAFERESIGNFLKKFDEYISLHQSKLSTLEQLKQSYLRKMFL